MPISFFFHVIYILQVTEWMLFFPSQGSTAFSLSDIPELDATISSFSAFEAKETGPLILSWAVFLCLISSLPGKEENNVLTVHNFLGFLYSYELCG